MILQIQEQVLVCLGEVMETSGVRGIGWDDLDTKDSWQVYLVDHHLAIGKT